MWLKSMEKESASFGELPFLSAKFGSFLLKEQCEKLGKVYKKETWDGRWRDVPSSVKITGLDYSSPQRQQRTY